MAVPADVVAKDGNFPSTSVKTDEEKEGTLCLRTRLIHDLHDWYIPSLTIIKSRQGKQTDVCRICCGWPFLAANPA